MPGRVSSGNRGGFVVRADDGGELIAKVCVLLGSVSILIGVVASDVIWTQ